MEPKPFLTQEEISNLEMKLRVSHECSNLIYRSEGGKIYCPSYCHNRFCLICSKITETARFYRYWNVIQKWPCVWSVTLTIPVCEAALLNETVQEINRVWKTIHDTVRKGVKRQAHKSPLAVSLSGIRKYEIKSNSVSNTYQPHIHLILNSKQAAFHYENLWLEKFPKALGYAQKVDFAVDKVKKKNSLSYLIKPGLAFDNVNSIAECEAIAVILNTVANLHTIEAFGELRGLVKEQKVKGKFSTSEMEKMNWHVTAYVSKETGECLTE
ncbi:MAG: hypothetical protein V4543_14820 [Bacteroidota bacterium]